MRLKSLELQGYKTFANRTHFEFAGPITAIVGPNGSGKSNIADSLRWVLGEQSYSVLRGKKTEDMIFAGSEQRPRAGMAAATITFDNSDGWLPIDFSEVAITRRAYRDGQNEYLINGQRVRLKDVSELLAQSGLAERTYTIIGQGLVDAALSLKAEERRRLFEEAAGIGLHRARREEALNRLASTRRNLERVQDILTEIQPRLRSLEKQARRAQEYEQVKADLRVVLRDWYGYHWQRAQVEVSEARETARRLESALEQARRQQEGQSQALEGLRQRALLLREELNEGQRQSAGQRARLESVSKALAVAKERLRALKDQEINLQGETNRLGDEQAYTEEQIEQANQAISHLIADQGEARAQVEAARATLSTRQAERAVAEKKVSAARQALAALQNRQGQLQARLVERQAAAERASQGLQTAQQALQAAQQEHDDTARRLKAAEQAHRKAQASRQQAEAAFSAHRQRTGESESARQKMLEQRSALQAEVARLRARLEVLEQAENSFQGYSAGARLLLQAARQQKLSASRGALSSYLDLPAELETAILAALGEYLDAVILDGDPAQALDLLGKEAARGALLPLPDIKAPPFPPHKWGGEEGAILGIAAQMVTAPPEIQPVIDLLLGQVWVVRDRQTARRLLAGNESPWLRAVTLNGEVFSASGPVLRGAGNGAKKDASSAEGQTILSRARQRRELNAALAEAQQRASDLEAQLKSLEADLRALQAEGDRLAQARRAARSQEEQASLTLNQTRLALEQATRQAAWQQEQLNRLQQEIQRSEGETEQARRELSTLDTQVEQARQQLRQESALLGNLPVDEFQAQLAHWNTQAAVADKALSGAQARQRERQEALERTRRALQSLHLRQAECGSQQQITAAEQEQQRQAEAEIKLQLEALRAQIEPTESELQRLDREQAAAQETEAAARQALTIADHHHSQARLTLTRRQEAMENLRRRIEEDFGLVAFEYAESMSGPTPLPLQGMVEQLPRLNQLPAEIEESIQRQRAHLRRMGPVNLEAQAEYQEVKTRHDFLVEQVKDLDKAEADVRQVIAELDGIMQREFRRTFNAVAEEFKKTFSRLFDGGAARLLLTDPDHLTDSGIDIEARLPGRRTQGLSLLSGGERSLTATALVFALLKVSPTPFCVLDEVDAMLDEANVGRFRDLLSELSSKTQFVIVTHNRNTVQAAEVIYGVTMGRDSTSQVVSLKLDEVSQVVD
jgi:chromosome segregation protein